MHSDKYLDSNHWNDSAFPNCEESTARYKETFIQPLNQPQSINHRPTDTQSTLTFSQIDNNSHMEFTNDFSGDINNTVNSNGNFLDSNPGFGTGDVLIYMARAVCIFGIAGNLLNLFALTRRRMRRSMMDHMEKCAQMGLISLAVSDLILCIAHLTHSIALVGTSQLVAYIDHSQFPLLLFSVYSEGLLNWFSLSGTFLTVVVAVGRFLVVCRPLHARSLISVRGTKAALIGSWFLALLFNLPRFFHYEVAVYPSCTERCPCSFKTREVGWLYRSQKKVLLVYKFAYFTLGVTSPLLVLIVCNTCLIAALRRSQKLQESCVADDPSRKRSRQTSRNRITPTLVCLVAAFILLVGPSEIVTFLRDEKPAVADFAGFRMAVELTNLFQLINYAANFILYCTVNADFRKVFIDLVACKRHKRQRGRTTTSEFLSENNHARINLREKPVNKRLPCWRQTAAIEADDKGNKIGHARSLEVSRSSQTCLTTCGHKFQKSSSAN